MSKTSLPPFAALVSIGLIALAGCTGGSGGASAGGTPAAASTEAPAPAAAAVGPANGATLEGRVKFDGQAPAPASIDMSGTPACASQHADPAKAETLVVNGGMLQNVIVYVKDGLTGSFNTGAGAKAQVLDQRGCTYHPHVAVMQVGQP